MAIYEPDFSIATEAFQGNTFILGVEWIIPLALAVFLMAMVTKDLEKWKVLALPIFVMERIVGLPVHYALLMGSGIMFALQVLSTQIVGNLLGATKKWTGKGDLVNRRLFNKKNKEWIKAEKRLAQANALENRNTRVGLAKKRGVIATGITNVLEKSKKKRGF